MKKLYFLSLIVCFCSFSAVAQDSSSDQIDPESADKVYDRITSFFNNISILGDVSVSDEKRAVYIDPTLNLFLGKGEGYYWGEDYYPPVSVYIGTDDNDVNPQEIPLITFLKNASKYGMFLTLAGLEVAQIIDIHEEDPHPWGTAIFYLCYVGNDGHLYICRNYNRKPVKMDVERGEIGWEDILLGKITFIGVPIGQ